jgi:glucokinase
MKPYAFGAHIGGTSIQLGLFRTSGILLEKWLIPTQTESHGNYIPADILRAVQRKAARHSVTWDEVEGLGICVPGPVADDGTVVSCGKLGWESFNILEKVKRLEPRLTNVRAANNVNAATLGELWQGAAKGRTSAVMVTLSAGIGGGVVSQGRIVTGSNGGAGELAHIQVNSKELEPCSCGNRGCLEQYCSTKGLVRCARKMLQENPKIPTTLRNNRELTARSICDAAKAGDLLALKLMDQLGEYLGWALTAVAGTVDPEVFIIGGRLAYAGSVLLDRVEGSYRKHAFQIHRDTDFTLAELGVDAAIYGCVRMLW